LSKKIILELKKSHLPNLQLNFCPGVKIFMKSEFLSPFVGSEKGKKCAEIQISTKFLLLGRKFVAKFEDEISSAQKSKFFCKKATFTSMGNHSFYLPLVIC